MVGRSKAAKDETGKDTGDSGPTFSYFSLHSWWGRTGLLSLLVLAVAASWQYLKAIEIAGRFGLAESHRPFSRTAGWTVVSEYPRIYVQDDFLSSEECEMLKKQVSGRLEPAKVVEKEENKYDQQVNVRNNQQIWLGYEEERDTPAIYEILKRMHRAARFPDDDAEALQIGHYGVDEKYEMHPDSDPRNAVARPATLITYLNDVEEGGETLFPLGNRSACTMQWRQDDAGNRRFGIQNCCDRQELLRIAAKKGRAVLFFNHDTTGQLDYLSEHAACQVKRGEKWIAQRWFRFEPYQRLVHPLDPRFDGLPLRLPQPHLGVRVVSQKLPNIYLIEDFLSDSECQALVDLMQQLPGFQEEGQMRHWASAASAELVEKISQRLSAAVLMPEQTGEALQMGRYASGDHQGFHFDNPTENESNPRVWTVILYLTGDGSVGDNAEGATIFPSGWCRSSLQQCCHMGAQELRKAMFKGEQVHFGRPYLIPPRKGRALLFRSLSTSGVHDPSALHGSCPSGSEGKIVAQKWFRQRPQ